MDEQFPLRNQPDTPATPAETAESGACGRCKRSEGPKGAFLAAYGEYGIVSVACRIAGIGRSSFYEWRKSAPDFAAACEIARQDAVDGMVAEARRRAVEGVTEEHVGKDGRTFTVRKYSDTPYSQGVKANVVFFTKGYPTERVWIYDARSNVPGVTKKDRPLSDEHFAEFVKCYGPDPNGKAKRKQGDSPAGKGYLGGDRWWCFSLAEVQQRDFKLDSFKWLKDESLEDADDLPPPEELATDAISELETAVEELNAVLALLENGNGANGKGVKKRT